MEKKAKLIWTSEARSEVGDIFAKIFEDSIAYADAWYEELDEKLNLLQSFPQMGRIVPEKQVSFLREVFVGSFRVIYTYLNDVITIITVRHVSAYLGKII